MAHRKTKTGFPRFAIHCVSVKVTLVPFVITHQMLTNFNNIWYYCIWGNLQQKNEEEESAMI